MFDHSWFSEPEGRSGDGLEAAETPTDDATRKGAATADAPISHAHLHSNVQALPGDYIDYDGTVQRWADADLAYPDCSCGCRWAAWLEGPLGSDWCVCTSPSSHRSGLLTFEHQAGFGCFEAGPEPPKPSCPRCGSQEYRSLRPEQGCNQCDADLQTQRERLRARLRQAREACSRLGKTE